MITPEQYQFLSELLRRHSGLSLGAGKEYLIESRLVPVAVTLGHADLAALLSALRAGASASVVKLVCDAMTTNETLFFRDGKPFAALEAEILPAAIARARAAGRPVRLWCAASSTGQEPYSIAMLVAQAEHKWPGTRVEILATDYSAAALARAKAGVYNQFEVQRGLPVQMLVKHFTQGPDGFRLKDDIRNRVRYQEINLLDPFPATWQFDIIFCRNVLIYFDVATKRDVLERMARLLVSGGSLFLGGTESTMGITDRVVRVPGHPAGVFCRPEDVAALTANRVAA
ncbi:MAG: protein-glutamate O-methyltransferase CheR [Gemmatimonadaceae bacterium]|nr:protein-glutamate O-methyltransferase CheR [Gemmatimonadaceae bacterium]